MKKLLFAWIILTAFLVNSCDILDQAQQVAMFSRCEFRLSSLTNAKIAGVNVQNIKSFNDLNMLDATRIATAYSTGSLPLTFTLNVQSRNPNTRPAGMNRLDWILMIDELEVLNGVTEQKITIPANGGTAVLPMELKIDLMKVLETKNVESLANFALNLTGMGNTPTRVSMRAKPTINIGTTPVTYPGYITIDSEFSSN